jgi:hypothetical protein
MMDYEGNQLTQTGTNAAGTRRLLTTTRADCRRVPPALAASVQRLGVPNLT